MTNEATMLSEPQRVWPRLTNTTSSLEETQSDHRLAQRIAGGDMQAFAEFYQCYHRRVYTLCLRMTNNIAEAEDLAQDVFIHVYRKIGSFRGESTILTWLHRVTVNQVLMHFRKGVVRHEQTTADGGPPESLAHLPETSSQMPVVDRLALDKAIAQLPPGYRAVFILHDVEGYEHTEIARICGISVGTTKSQLHKARMKLRKLLKQEFQPPEPNQTEAS
jgi:RNA polymerase sigma-70 factor (ECF subfamily)